MPLAAKPYLRSVRIDPQAEVDPACYPFTIPAVRELGVALAAPQLLPARRKPVQCVHLSRRAGPGRRPISAPALARRSLHGGAARLQRRRLLSARRAGGGAVSQPPDGRAGAAGIHAVAYEDTEHYAITRDFLNHYPRRLEQLLGEA